jgi:fructose-1,6-bisphosphatase/inositol monophosphatase family enzyme
VTDGELLDLLGDAAAAVRAALDTVDDWGPSGRKAGQYAFDLVADEAALTVLDKAEVGILSEETGLHHPEREIWVALDPVDGSTNASRRIPWYATSLCVVDRDGPRAALVVNQATGDRFEAVRGEGATWNGAPIRPRACERIADAVLGITWIPPKPVNSRQIRALGAASLDICAVAFGGLDAYIDFSASGHSPWDYLAGVLVCWEAGAGAAEASGRDLVTRTPFERRTIVAAATPTLLDEAVALRASMR